MINGVAVSYGDIAIGAKEAFTPTANNQAEFSKIEQLKVYNLSFPNYGNATEGYSVSLDGNSEVFPRNTKNANIGYWTSELSGNNGEINTVITLKSDGLYASQGFTFTFDEPNGIYCTDLSISWYRVLDSEELLSTEEFQPNSAVYFCKNRVENFNKVVIDFRKINMPNVRMRLKSLDYGYGTVFYGNELRSATQIQKIDPVSTQIPINTFTFVLDSKRPDMEFQFQTKQPIVVTHNGRLISTNFVKKAKRTGQKMWEVSTEDYIGIMEKTQFKGGIYSDKNAIELISEIFTSANVPYEIDERFADLVVSGYIPYTTCRDALMQVAFAVQAVADTSGSNKVRMRKLGDTIAQTIPKRRIMQGQRFEETEAVTGVSITVHSYKPIAEETEIYKAEDNGTGQGIFVKFTEPYHDLSIVNGSLIEHGENFAIFDANDGCILKGKKYEHKENVRTKVSEVISANSVENIKSISNATLVSTSNVEMLLDKCLEYMTIPQKTYLLIVEGMHVKGGDYIRYRDMLKYGDGFKYGDKSPYKVTYDNMVSVGDLIAAETEYLGEVNGRVTEQKFALMAGNIIKEAVIR